MAEHPIEGMMGVTMEKIRQLVDANTIIGEPITVDGATIIPISRVTFGFASGGSDVGAKTNKQMFGGGTGAGEAAARRSGGGGRGRPGTQPHTDATRAGAA